MTSISLHPTPSRQTVAREQLRAVGLELRTETILYLGALVLLSVLGISAAIHEVRAGHGHGNSGLWFNAGAALPIAIVGFVLPFSVWRNENPARRSYHWAMPVDRASHTLMKVASGWVWLMAATVVYLLWIAGLSAVIAAIEHSIPLMAPPAAWEWLVPFTAATVAYLLGSTFVIASDHPWRWIVGLWLAFLACLMFSDALELHALELKLAGIMEGHYGAEAALFGKVWALDRAAHLIVPSAARWVGATAVWGAIAGVGVAAAMRRREEG
jgi:hypothetical protein